MLDYYHLNAQILIGILEMGTRKCSPYFYILHLHENCKFLGSDDLEKNNSNRKLDHLK